MGKWSLHIDNYNCNRYKEKEGKDEQGKKSSEARRALERYLHYYTRYSNHLNSLKLERASVSKTEDKMERMQGHTGMTWVDLDFLRTAVKILLKCRGTLAYSYVFAYYSNGSNYIEIFENNQRDLESSVEELSRLIEYPMLKTQEDLAVWRQKVVNITVYVTTRREKLLSDVKSGLLENRFAFSE
jgi:ariadne-1